MSSIGLRAEEITHFRVFGDVLGQVADDNRSMVVPRFQILVNHRCAMGKIERGSARALPTSKTRSWR